jgi:hypothetical protein
MNPNRQAFSDNLTTTGTCLRRTSGGDLHHTSASFYRFAQSALYKLPPGYIGNTPVNSFIVALLHILNIQSFKDDQPESVDQFSAFLMSEVITPVFDTGMKVVKSFDGLAAFWTSFRECAYFALDSFQILFVLLHPTLTLNRFAIAESGKGGQAQVNTDNLNRGRQRARLHFTRKASKPVTQAITPDCQPLDSSLKGPVKFDFDITYLGEMQFTLFQPKTRLRIGEAIIPTKSLEPGEAVLVSGFDPAKERFIGQVNPLLNVLQELRIDLGQFRIGPFPACKVTTGIVQCQALLLDFPRLLSQTKRSIVELSANLKGLIEAGALRFGRKHSEFVRLSHPDSIARFMQITNCINYAKAKGTSPYIPPGSQGALLRPSPLRTGHEFLNSSGSSPEHFITTLLV